MTDIHLMNVVSVPSRRGPKRIYTREEILARRRAFNVLYHQRRKNDPGYRAKRAEWAKKNKHKRKIKKNLNRKYYPKKPSTPDQRQRDALRKRLKRQTGGEVAREYGRLARAKRRARENKAEGFFTKEDVATLRKAQKGRCVYFRVCGRKLSEGFHVDHIVPLSKNGTNWPKNIQLLCVTCNCSKWNKDPIEFSRQQGLLL